MSRRLSRYWQCRDCKYFFEHQYRSSTPPRCPICDGVIQPITFSFYKQLEWWERKFRPLPEKIRFTDDKTPIGLSVEDVWRMANEELSKCSHKVVVY